MSFRFVILSLVLLTGCQTSHKPTVTEAQPDQYQAVIDGGLGINFSDPLSKLVEMGFKENTAPKKQYEVGEWTIPFFEASGFFNFGMEVSTSPSTGRIYSIRGLRLYPARRYPNHFDACTEDFTLLRTKIEAKYPSLHKSYEPGLNITGEHSNVAFYEGKGSYEYLSTPRYFGRNIDLSCSIQESGDQVVGSMLFVAYSEGYEASKTLRADQKRVFEEQSGTRLEEKGINADDL